MKIINIDQNTPEWLDVRRGKITGSKLKQIVVKRGNKRKLGFYELLADRLAIEEEPENPMERGSRLEDDAIAKFTEHTGLKVDRVGFCVSGDNPNIAVSPDGMVKVGKKYKYGVEIKCLSASRHLQAYFEKEIPIEYEEQAMQYFIVNPDQEKLYFVFYDPRVTAKPIHWLEIEREDVEDKIEFYKEYQEKVLKEVDELLVELAF